MILGGQLGTEDTSFGNDELIVQSVKDRLKPFRTFF
jgi:hypothetical protein